MSIPIEIRCVDEFCEIESVPPDSITEDILLNVRSLYEIKEFEPFIREILCDPDETPHCATEMADILAYVHIKGTKTLAAFVLKGKSYDKVISKNVTHQFAKMRRITGVGLMVFGAVGSIQDDAKSDFMQTAEDAGCDYLTLNCLELARLFIAYKKICPEDGTCYTKAGICKNGHIREQAIEVKISNGIKYQIMNQKDISHIGAKRYSAVVLLGQRYNDLTIRTSIKKATDELRSSNYYRNEMSKAHWGKTPAHVVWLYVTVDFVDVQNANWVCRSLWIDKNLDRNMRPMTLDGNDHVEDIEIRWNSSYDEQRVYFEKHPGNKEQTIEINSTIVKKMRAIADEAIQMFSLYDAGKITESELVIKMQKLKPEINAFYDKAGNIPFPPPDCADYDEACQGLYATIADMFLYFSEKGLKTWDEKTRKWLMGDVRDRYIEDLKKVEYEEKKIQ